MDAGAATGAGAAAVLDGLDVDHGKRQHGKGAPGSRENPERLENVPGHVIPILADEFDDFGSESGEFLAGERGRGHLHPLPPQTGRLRPAPGRRADDPREAALRRRLARADGGLRRRDRALGAAAQRPHHHPPEHPAPPRAARRRGQADPRARRGRALLARGLRQHGPQRHRRPLRRRRRRRGLRPDPLRRRLRPLLRPPPGHPGDAAQVEDRLLLLPGRSRDRADPRHRLPAGDRATASAASRSGSAAAPRSCRASPTRSTTSSASTTAPT